jgi:RHS repeat-associated protein
MMMTLARNTAYSTTGYDAALLPPRNYNTSIGRFTSFDTFDGNTAEPITLNHYLYAGADPVNHTDPGGHDFSVSETLSVEGINNIIEAGIGHINSAVRVYNTAQNLIDVLNYANFVAELLSAFAQPTVQAAASTIVAAIQKQFGVSGVSDITTAFTSVLSKIGPHWDDISKAITAQATPIAEEVAAAVLPRIGNYTRLQAEGRLKAIFFTPSGPGTRSNPTFVDIGSNLQIGIESSGGRLFGFGLRTSKKSYDQIFRIDYWENNQLDVHYHVLSSSYYPSRHIWP